MSRTANIESKIALRDKKGAVLFIQSAIVNVDKTYTHASIEKMLKESILKHSNRRIETNKPTNKLKPEVTVTSESTSEKSPEDINQPTPEATTNKSLEPSVENSPEATTEKSPEPTKDMLSSSALNTSTQQ